MSYDEIASTVILIGVLSAVAGIPIVILLDVLSSTFRGRRGRGGRAR